MAARGKKAQRIKDQIIVLEAKKHAGFIQCLAAIAAFALLIAIKLWLVSNGFEWANTDMVNIMFFITALVFAGVAGYGSRKWKRARDQILALETELHG